MNQNNNLSVGLATCEKLPEPDFDHRPLAQALEQRGCRVTALAWDGSDQPRDIDVCVVRSTWNYYHHPDRFLAWIDDQAQRSLVLNPAHIVRWNSDKRYLRELQSVGVDIVETVWFERSTSPDRLSEAVEKGGWSRFVLKPLVSAASFQTRAFARHELPAALEFLGAQLPVREMMAQPFMSSIESVGEKSIAWLDGEITHAWIKRPRFAGQHEAAEPTRGISSHDRSLAERAIEQLRNDIVYARIDLMYDDQGQPRLSELELIEPSLYFDFCPTGLARFADAIVREGNARKM